MNDQLIFENYLLVLKSTVEVYVHGTLESSNESIRCMLKDCLDNIMTFQAQTYDLMQKNNWYQKENVDNSKIKETYEKIEMKN